MKKLIIVLISLLLFACTDSENKVKVIDNYDEQYLTDEKVESEPGDDAVFDKISNDLKQIVLDVYKNDNTPVKSYLDFRLYVNEDGTVDAVKELPVSDEYLLSEGNYKKIDTKALINRIADAAENWKFEPAKKDGESVKYRGDINVVIRADENGKIIEEIPALSGMGKALSKLKFASKQKYFDDVDEQPYPVGGMQAIQEKIVYPEEAKIKGIQGKTFVMAYINKNGDVDEVSLLRGFNSQCDSVAMAAIKQTKFTPGKQNG